MTKLKTLTASLAAAAMVGGIGLAYAQNSDTTTAPGQGAPAAADSQYNSTNPATSTDSTTTAPADMSSTTAPADTTASPDASVSTDSSMNADTTADSTFERAPQADRN